MAGAVGRFPHGLEWDHAAVLSALGSAANLRTALRKAGFPSPNPHTAWMWRTRNRVPASWLPTVLWVLVVLHDHPLDDFIREAEPRPVPAARANA